MDVGDLNVAVHLQLVDLVEGPIAVGEVEHVLAVHKHLKPLVPTADGYLMEQTNGRPCSCTVCLKNT